MAVIAAVAAMAALIFWRTTQTPQPGAVKQVRLAPPETPVIPAKPQPELNRTPSRPAAGAEAPHPTSGAPMPDPSSSLNPRRLPPPNAIPAPTPSSQLKTLEEILASRNDNDPRLDRDFNELSVEAKRLFREKYSRTPPELRNDRGTIVYLLGRNLTSAEDWAFLRTVVGEPACLSLFDCAKEPRLRADHGESGDEVTLAYPALVALNRAERALKSGSAASVQEARRLIATAKDSPVPIVARKALELEKTARLGH